MQCLRQRIVADQLLNNIVDSYNNLLEEESQPMDLTRRPSVVYTASTGRPSMDIPREE